MKGVVLLPLKTKNPTNNRQHWRTVWKRSLKEREQTDMFVKAMLAREGIVLPCVVTITRLSAGELDDDNIRAATKAVRDGVADAFHVADNDPRLRFEYAQERCRRNEYGVRISVNKMLT